MFPILFFVSLFPFYTIIPREALNALPIPTIRAEMKANIWSISLDLIHNQEDLRSLPENVYLSLGGLSNYYAFSSFPFLLKK